MLSPEVCNFAAPDSLFSTETFQGKVLLNNSTITRFNYSHLINVVIPDTLRVPERIQNSLLDDCEYYQIAEIRLSDLVDEKFISCFVRKGKLTLLAINSRIDCDNFVGVTPQGKLILNIDKDTYHSLGVDGKPSHFTSKLRSRYIINLDLKDDCLLTSKARLWRLKSNFQNFEKFTAILTWEPPEPSVCPSTIAKYFSDMNYRVKLCSPYFKSNTEYSIKVPTIDFEKFTRDDFGDFLEWIGMVSMGGDLETNDQGDYVNSYVTPLPNEELGQVKCLTWRGLFTATQVQKLIEETLKFNEAEGKPWITIYVQGYSDAPVSWDNEEHHYFTNGDNSYAIVFNNERGAFCVQKCSKKCYN